MVKQIWVFMVVILVALLAGCAQADSGQAVPTLAPSPTAPPTATPIYNNVMDAQAIATTFLQDWKNGDIAGMYSLISLSSQQAYSFDSFRQLYEDVHAEIRLTTFDFQAKALVRENSRIVTLIYDVTMASSIVGEFSDFDRQMQLMLDEGLQAWRVAWSPGTIFSEMGNGGQVRMETVQPLRGSIYDRNGHILADMNGRIISVQIVQNEIPDRDACFAELATIFDEGVDAAQTRLNRNNPDWLADIGLIEEAMFHAHREPLETVCAAQFEGRPTRRYIYGDLFAHIIGIVGYPAEDQIPALEAVGFRQDSIIGQSGIEASWDEVLRGTAGGRLSLVNGNGETLRLLAERGPQPAQDVYLTLDLDLQRYVLTRIVEEYTRNLGGWGSTSEGASGIVADVRTGEILAMVSYPTFDANAFTPFPAMGRAQADQIIAQVTADPRDPQLNRAAQGRYPSGSTMKTFSAIAALDSGVYAFDTRYNSTGTWNRDIPRRDWNGTGHGLLNLSQALTQSCNSCFYEVGYQMNNSDPTLLPDYLNRMGFGLDPGLSDIATSSGLIGTPETKSLYHAEPWSFSDEVDMAIGQGMVEVSPLQMAFAYMQVANGGTHYRPQLIDHTQFLTEIDHEMTPEVISTLDIRDDILPYLVEGLCNVVTRTSGTANYIFKYAPELLADYGACGKTGTAENPPRLAHAWFAGWTPAENPDIIVVVMIENAGEGSRDAAPVVRDVMEFYHYGENLPEHLE